MKRLGTAIAKLVIDQRIGIALGAIERHVGIAVGGELEVAGIEEAGPRVAVVHARVHLHRIGQAVAGRVGGAADVELVLWLVIRRDRQRQRTGLGQLVGGCLGLHGDELDRYGARRAGHAVPVGQHAVELCRGERVRPRLTGQAHRVGGVGGRPLDAHLDIVGHVARKVGGRIPRERHGRFLRLVSGQGDGRFGRAAELHDILRPVESIGVVLGVAGREAGNRRQEEKYM